MVHCCVPYCNSNSSLKENVGFHSFPDDPILRDKWRVAISREKNNSKSLWLPNQASKICSKHFTTQDFSVSTISNRRLLPNVVPSVFHGYPEHKQKTRKMRKSPKKRLASGKLSDGPKVKRVCVRSANFSFEETGHDASTSSSMDMGIQVSSLNKVSCKCKSKSKSFYKLPSKIKTLKQKIKFLESEKKKSKKSNLEKKILKIVEDSKKGNLKSLFLLEQINAYGKKHIKYEETTLKFCVLWQRKAPAAYEFVRSLNIMQLPHSKTLKNFVGFSNGETGITSLIKQRLSHEFENLQNEEEKMGSLLIDEMAIKEKLLYDRNLDQFLGYSTSEIEEIGCEDKLANRLLCFLFKGLSTAYRLPVAFYFTKQLTGSQLCCLTKKVLKEVEIIGFRIIRIVTDNAKVNFSMMKELSGGDIAFKIPHPNDKERTLFLSFDSSHILKNIRSQFLDKDFFYKSKVISSSHIKALYDTQKHLDVKPVRGLTRKVLFPTNLEKMNVKRAKYVFSDSVIAALKSLPTIAPQLIANKLSLSETIVFLENVKKWHDIHDVCNFNHALFSKNFDKSVFTDIYDERFQWLEENFLPYMADIQKSNAKDNKISNETYEALVLTTKSTVACTQYLLKCGFHYVLSRNLNSDDIELLFSHLRRKGGFNDMMDVRSCMYAIESTLKTGIINPSSTSNVERQIFKTLDTLNKQQLKNNIEASKYINLPTEVLQILQRPLEEQHVDLTLSSLAMIAGYLVRVAEEQTNCGTCLEPLCSAKTNSPMMNLIKMQDRGSLFYPTRKFVYFLRNILQFVFKSLQYFSKQCLIKKLKIFVLPEFMKYFRCKKNCDESAKLCDIIVTKFLKPILVNHAQRLSNETDTNKKLHCKPLSRKVLKL